MSIILLVYCLMVWWYVDFLSEIFAVYVALLVVDLGFRLVFLLGLLCIGWSFLLLVALDRDRG
jgi:hypothetical protein